MITQILDMHTHSRYSRACSKHLELPTIAKTCELRGIDIVVTSDFTHPAWFSHMKEHLKEDTEGLYVLKDGSSTTKFIIGTEIASIRKHKGKTRRVHLLIFSPDLEAAEVFNRKLTDEGFNLTADGRPILGRTCKEILQMMLEIDERMVMIPAHAWTPWFGIFGSKGGYDHLEEAFDELAPSIFSIETGLSSDPAMNWRCSMLDGICLTSNSDAHSPQKLGREANVLQFPDLSDVTYSSIMRIIREQDKKQFLYTVEFYPEEGKYHMDGHRDCGIVMHPKETTKHRGICPICKRPLVIGVMNRINELADRTEEQAFEHGVGRIPYKSVVPLPEIIADTIQVSVTSKKVQRVYHELLTHLGSEFSILLSTPLSDIAAASSQQIAHAVERVRNGRVHVSPGYDGVFGTVHVFAEGEDRGFAAQSSLNLF